MLWLDMGLGKTIITLTSIAWLLKRRVLRNVLIVAPLRVVQTVWKEEAQSWEHTRHLTFSTITGTPAQRMTALETTADIHLINYENLKWLFKHSTTWDGCVLDEITKMKNSTSVRMRVFRKYRHQFKWLTGLTGTPASDGYADLHGQYLAIDGGKRLMQYKTHFKNEYFKTVAPWVDVLQHGAKRRIQERISDITLEMSASDYNPLPSLIINDIKLKLPEKLRKLYDSLEKDFFYSLDNGTEISAPTNAAKSNKCLQFCSGTTYPVPNQPTWENVHDLKLNALEEIIDSAAGNPILCAYNYRSDAQKIEAYFKKLKPVNLGTCKASELTAALERCKNGSVKLMLAHPASVGYGIDGLQNSCHTIVWYGLNWSLKLYSQLNARICRQRQIRAVTVHRLLIDDTLDMVQAQMLSGKSTVQTDLRRAINLYRRANSNATHQYTSTPDKSEYSPQSTPF